MTEEPEIERQWWFPIASYPFVVLVVAPLQLARPCDPAGNCIPWKQAILGAIGYWFWVGVVWILTGEVIQQFLPP